MEELWQQNEDFFQKTVLKYMELNQEIEKEMQKEKLDLYYKKGQLSLLQEAKRILESDSQYKFIQFSDMEKRLETFIDEKKAKEKVVKKGELNLQGITLPRSKKRGYKETAEDKAQLAGELLSNDFQKAKKQ